MREKAYEVIADIVTAWDLKDKAMFARKLKRAREYMLEHRYAPGGHMTREERNLSNKMSSIKNSMSKDKQNKCEN